MRVIPKAANDMMDVGRLQGFDVSVVSLFFTSFPASPLSRLLAFRIPNISLRFVSGQNNGARKTFAARSATGIGNIERVDERKGMASLSFRAKYYLQRSCRQEDSVHQSCLHI